MSKNTGRDGGRSRTYTGSPPPTPASSTSPLRRGSIAALDPVDGSISVVKVNMTPLTISEKLVYQVYKVQITVVLKASVKTSEVDVLSNSVRRDAIRQLVEQSDWKCQPLYGGGDRLYTVSPLPFQRESFNIILTPPNGTRSWMQNNLRIDIAFMRSKAMDPHPSPSLEDRKVLKAALAQTAFEKSTAVGDSFFVKGSDQPKTIDGGLVIVSGYNQTIRLTSIGMCLQTGVSFSTCYQPITVNQFVGKFLNLSDGGTRLLDAIDYDRVKEALTGVKVELIHRDRLNIIVKGITLQPTSQLEFPVQGTTRSLVQYFKERYRIEIKDVYWPSVFAGTESQPIYFPMEVCKIAEHQRYSQPLNQKQLSALSSSSRKSPLEMETYVSQIMVLNKYDEDKFVKEFGIKVADGLASIDAHVLDPPQLTYHDRSNGFVVTLTPKTGEWNMDDKKFFNGGKVEHWACVNFSLIPPDTANKFFKNLVYICNRNGMTFNPNHFYMETASSSLIKQTLVDIHKKFKEANDIQLQLLIIILPDRTGSYGHIKQICETELGIMTQCCLPGKAENPSYKYLGSLSLKINVKVGGQNTVLASYPTSLDSETSIIFGADVSHPKKGSKFPSIAAVVASMKFPNIGGYRCLVSAQTARAELIEGLYKDPEGGLTRGMISEHLLSFWALNYYLPNRIIFYRDGVAEHQFSEVLQYELDQIRKACSYVGSSAKIHYNPKITFVVVQKRHHVRFFPTNHNDIDGRKNILPGTVVDRGICHPTLVDFYLCSHAGNQGTSRAARYIVLWDDNKYILNELQKLTYHLCFTCPTSTRSLAIVPPVHYAHLGAFRARYYIEGYGEPSTAAAGEGRNATERTDAVQSLPQVKDCLKGSKYYC